MFQIRIFLMILVTCVVSFAGAGGPAAKKSTKKVVPKTEAANSSSKLLLEVESRYVNSTALKSTVRKTLKLKMLNQERTQTGSLLVKKPGMFRLDLSGEEKSLALTDGKTIWVVNYPTDPTFDNTVRVLRSRDPKKVQSQTLLAFMLGRGGLLDQYKIESETSNGDNVRFELLAKKASEEVPKVFIVVSAPKKEIVSLEYFDKLENLTRVEFSNTKFDQKLSTKQFSFSVPKGAEVTDL